MLKKPSSLQISQQILVRQSRECGIELRTWPSPGPLICLTCRTAYARVCSYVIYLRNVQFTSVQTHISTSTQLCGSEMRWYNTHITDYSHKIKDIHMKWLDLFETLKKIKCLSFPPHPDWGSKKITGVIGDSVHILIFVLHIFIKL